MVCNMFSSRKSSGFFNCSSSILDGTWKLGKNNRLIECTNTNTIQQHNLVIIIKCFEIGIKQKLSSDWSCISSVPKAITEMRPKSCRCSVFQTVHHFLQLVDGVT